jgi:hypothetical protein
MPKPFQVVSLGVAAVLAAFLTMDAPAQSLSKNLLRIAEEEIGRRPLDLCPPPGHRSGGVRLFWSERSRGDLTVSIPCAARY